MLRAFKVTLFSLLAVTVVLAAYGAGYVTGPGSGLAPTAFLTSQDPSRPERLISGRAPEQFRLLEEVWEVLRSDFVEPQGLDPDRLGRGAIEGLIAALGDAHTSYIDPEDYRTERSGISGSYEGIGASVELREGIITIVAPLSGSPADQAGIRARDRIVAVNGESTQGMSLTEAVSKIKGPKGSKVTLAVLHDGDTRPVTLEITRGEIRTTTVSAVTLPGNISHIQIRQFAQRTGNEMQDALRQARNANAAGIVLDLRNNPGGLLDQTVEVTSQFLDGGIAGYQVNRNGDRTELRLRNRGETTSTPMVVLVNGGSASGSELLAGALQDRGRAVVIGTKTFGKGSVNHLRELSDGSALYVTIGRWLTPNGRQIEGQGLAPDVEVRVTEEDIRAQRDVQMERAIQTLQGRTAQGIPGAPAQP